MLYVALIIGLGVAVYAAGQADWAGTRLGDVRHARIVGDRLVVGEDEGRTLHYYDLDALDYLAVRSGRRAYTLLMGFGGELVALSERDSGVEALLDTLIRVPPEGADFSAFGEAMESRRTATYVFLDSTRGQ